MSINKQSFERNATAGEVWPRKLNKLLIGVGVLAFGLIIADRLVNMFKADDLPVVADVEQLDDTPEAELLQANESVEFESNEEDVSTLSSTDKAVVTDSLSIDEVFGSPLVFVSASEPAYVITENDLRIDVGSQLADDVKLAGVTGDRVILDRAGDLVSIALPDPDK